MNCRAAHRILLAVAKEAGLMAHWIRDECRRLVERIFPDWEQRLVSMKKSCRQWQRSLASACRKALIFALCTWLASAALLFFLKSLWYVYSNSPAGEAYSVSISPAAAERISDLFSRDPVDFAFALTIKALLTVSFTLAANLAPELDAAAWG
jgi:hypothetical protein